jgi:hypothetical protein
MSSGLRVSIALDTSRFKISSDMAYCSSSAFARASRSEEMRSNANIGCVR